MVEIGTKGIPETKEVLVQLAQEILAIGEKRPDQKDVRKYLSTKFPRLYEKSGQNR
jgi:hypothetical protein